MSSILSSTVPLQIKDVTVKGVWRLKRSAASDCLILHGRVPPSIEHYNMSGLGKVKADAPCVKRHVQPASRCRPCETADKIGTLAH